MASLVLGLVFASCTGLSGASSAGGQHVLPKPSETVIYEVNLRAFSKNDSFSGVTSRLGDLKHLGVNVVWLMPIFPVGKVRSAGGLGSPYAVANYTAINPEFGSMNDFAALVARAHELKMAVILDWVADHTAWDNPWLTHKDWYMQDGKGNHHHPAQYRLERRREA